jgi:predicted deacylase
VIELGVLRFDAPVLGGLELHCMTARGARDGPRLCLLAGVHGGEYSSIAAARRTMRELDTGELSGTVTCVPVSSPTAFRARAPFVVPEDGKNLNRCFPGRPDGSFAEALAHHLFSELIAGSDYLVDLHGGDIPEALEPFALYDESPVEATACAMAMAFGFPYVLRQVSGEGPIAGTTSASAAAAGIPAIIAEAGGCGLLEADAVELHVRGLRNVFRRLGMLPGEPDAPPPQWTVGRFVWLRAGAGGWWEPSVRAGERLAADAPVGTMFDLYGDVIEQAVTPEAGVVLFVTTSPAVEDGGLLLGLGGDVSPLERTM